MLPRDRSERVALPDRVALRHWKRRLGGRRADGAPPAGYPGYRVRVPGRVRLCVSEHQSPLLPFV